MGEKLLWRQGRPGPFAASQRSLIDTTTSNSSYGSGEKKREATEQTNKQNIVMDSRSIGREWSQSKFLGRMLVYAQGVQGRRTTRVLRGNPGHCWKASSPSISCTWHQCHHGHKPRQVIPDLGVGGKMRPCRSPNWTGLEGMKHHVCIVGIRCFSHTHLSVPRNSWLRRPLGHVALQSCHVSFVDDDQTVCRHRNDHGLH